MEGATTKKKAVYSLASYRYGLGNFFTTIITNLSSTYFSAFLTISVGLSAAAMGSAMSIASVVDTISIPIIGILIQKSNFKSGKFRPWILWGAIACAIFNWLRFNNFGLTGASAVFYFGAMYTLCYLAYNFVYCPYTGLLPVLAPDPGDRASYAACRIQCNSIAKFLLSLVAVTLFEKIGYSTFAAILSVLCFLGFYQLYMMAKPYDIPEPVGETGKARASDVSIWEMIRSIISYPMLMFLIAGILKIATYFSVTSLSVYYYTYVIGDKALLTVYLSASTALMIGGAFLTPFVSKLAGGARNAYIIGGIIYGGSMLISFATQGNALLFTILLAVGYVGYSFMHSAEAAVYSNLVDYTLIKTGKDLKGFLMTIFSLSPKVGGIFQGLILGVGLSLIGFNAENITDQAIAGLPVLFALLPAILLAIVIVAMLLYPLTDKKIAEMKKQAGIE
ncbi:MFS transporter [Anaerotruncus sp. AF02-27]|jgi:Na+/melibiose symporter-like transporter|uniref:MFS transporter n=1 Tax=Anaerotruncus TaxID=244127 RepID=UPI000E506AA2|nr:MULTISPECIES: MFS transporter [Anaerotruncus]RGX56323.1 MFS transporter [Anaerotruncus sp. AF02-27]